MAATQAANYLEPWQDLSGKVVMVTGASSGIGRVVCLDLAKAGCSVVAAARRIDRLKSVCDEINNLPPKAGRSPRAVAVVLDISAHGSSVEASVEEAWKAFGRIDALLNNAGIRGYVNSSLDTTEAEWNETLMTNLRGTWLVSKYVGRLMRDSKLGGSIINVSSIAGLPRVQFHGAVAYSSSKTGLHAMTRLMALELGAYKIRVNGIAPGLFESEITSGLMKKKWLGNVVKRVIPLQDTGTSDPALTSLVRYLIHDSSGYVSGSIFTVDAGATLPGIPLFSSL